MQVSPTDFVTLFKKDSIHQQYPDFCKRNIPILTLIVAPFSLLPLWLYVQPHTDLSVLQAICDVSLAQISDVNKAVAAAKEAFEEGEWGKMNPRDRGRLIYKSVHLILSIWAQL